MASETLKAVLALLMFAALEGVLHGRIFQRMWGRVVQHRHLSWLMPHHHILRTIPVTRKHHH